MILVVDDHPDTRRAVAALLKIDGYEVMTASSGEEAMSFLASPRLPHCLVLDLAMPGMDGFQVLHRIRGDDRLKHLRVIVYSAHDGPLKDRALAAGADAFVLKTSLDWVRIGSLIKEHCGPSTLPTDDQSSPGRKRGVG